MRPKHLPIAARHADKWNEVLYLEGQHMTRTPRGSIGVNGHRPKTPRLAILAIVTAFITVGSVAGAAEPVGMGAAGAYAVIANQTITNGGNTTLNGHVGLSPGSAVTGFETVTLNGELHLADTNADNAMAAMSAAYNNAAGQTVSATIGTELGGTTVPGGGVYNSGSGTFEITGTVILDGQNDPNAVFIFQMGSTLVTAGSATVSLINGAQACNVYWRVGSSATLGAANTFRGTILAATSITLGAGTTIAGRALARDGSITLSANTITPVGCAAPVVVTTTSTVAATTTTAVGATTTTAAGGATTTTAAGGATTTTVQGVTTTSTVAGSTDTTVAGDTTTTLFPEELSRLVGPSTTMVFPVGAAATGGGSSAAGLDLTQLGLGLVLLSVAVGVIGVRRHSLLRDS
jgi:hypothetical protein